jgi:hypothetical protein
MKLAGRDVRDCRESLLKCASEDWSLGHHMRITIKLQSKQNEDMKNWETGSRLRVLCGTLGSWRKVL